MKANSARQPISNRPPCGPPRLIPIPAVVKRTLPGLPHFLLLLLLLLLMLPALVQAQDYTFTTNNGTITITGYTGPGGTVDIPSTINGLPVTSIGESAFQNNINLTSITIPSGVTNIGAGPFVGCTSLSAITVDALNSVYDSVAGVLFNTTQTRLIQYPAGKAGSDYTIPNSVTNIGNAAFFLCTSLTSVTIPDSVTSIGDDAFGSCSSLTSVTLPDSVTSIGSGAFSFCFSLTSVTMGNSVTIIAPQAFFLCTGLTSITLPDSVTSIYGGAFEGCDSLTAITVGVSNPVYSSVDGVLFNKSQTRLIQCPMGKAGSYTFPNSVTNIGDSAFYSCTSLTSVTIPDSVTRIGDFAFIYCTSLTGVYFKGNAPSVGLSVFHIAENATVYYLSGTTGWGPFFGGRPTALWKPLANTADGSFGVRTNQFGFNITWASGRVIVVEACANLANPIWSPLQTNTLSGDSFYFSDPQWTNYPTRFYRLRSP